MSETCFEHISSVQSTPDDFDIKLVNFRILRDGLEFADTNKNPGRVNPTGVYPQCFNDHHDQDRQKMISVQNSCSKESDCKREMNSNRQTQQTQASSTPSKLSNLNGQLVENVNIYRVKLAKQALPANCIDRSSYNSSDYMSAKEFINKTLREETACKPNDTALAHQPPHTEHHTTTFVRSPNAMKRLSTFSGRKIVVERVKLTLVLLRSGSCPQQEEIYENTDVYRVKFVPIYSAPMTKV